MTFMSRRSKHIYEEKERFKGGGKKGRVGMWIEIGGRGEEEEKGIIKKKKELLTTTIIRLVWLVLLGYSY
jgi:hypothetical protein